MREDFFSARTRMDAHRRDADGPGRIPDGHLQEHLVGSHVFPVETVADDAEEILRDVVLQALPCQS